MPAVGQESVATRGVGSKPTFSSPKSGGLPELVSNSTEREGEEGREREREGGGGEEGGREGQRVRDRERKGERERVRVQKFWKMSL